MSDAATYRRSLAQQLDGATLFAQPEPPAPSVPTPGSEAAADLILHSPFRRKSWRMILTYLATQDAPVSREHLSDALDIPQHSLCARLSELSPVLVERTEGACTSRAGIAVQGYRLTQAGRERVAKALERLP